MYIFLLYPYDINCNCSFVCEICSYLYWKKIYLIFGFYYSHFFLIYLSINRFGFKTIIVSIVDKYSFIIRYKSKLCQISYFNYRINIVFCRFRCRCICCCNWKILKLILKMFKFHTTKRVKIFRLTSYQKA